MAPAHRPAATIALFGGDEFTPAAVTFDRHLLAAAAADPAIVAILPTAAARENPRFAAANGVRHFERLGAHAHPVMIVDRESAGDDRLVDELRAADLIYLTGGDPVHLVASLPDTQAWRCIQELVRGGTAIAGSSAGAMALCDTLRVGAKQVAGLGLVPGVSVIPHFERSADGRVAQLQASVRDGGTILALDGATGCYSIPAGWAVAGPGRALLISSRAVEVLAHGDSFATA